jgi:hypothetical protein
MRGRSREEVLGALRRARGAEPEPRPSLVDLAVLGVTPDAGRGYDVAKAPLQIKVRIQAPPIPAAILRQIGAPPAWSIPVPTTDVLGPVYEGAGMLARSIALAVDSEVLASMQAEAARAPTTAPAARPRARRPAAQPSQLVQTPVMPVVIRRKKVEVAETTPAGTTTVAPIRRRRPR